MRGKFQQRHDDPAVRRIADRIRRENLRGLGQRLIFHGEQSPRILEDTPIELCYLPRGSPELNPAEECWRRLDQALGSQLFDTLDDLRDAALAALDSISPPNLFTYLCP